MKNLKIFLLLVLVLLFSFQSIPGQAEECDECINNPGSCCNEFPGICNPPPGNDHADDTMSISNFVSNSSLISTGKGTVAILNRGYWQAAEQLFGNFSDNINLVEITGDSWPDFVILPSGALFGKRNDTTFKYALEQYVSRGGTILCFVQQDAGDYSVIPVPEGDIEVPGKCWSCTTFFKMHNFSCTNFPQKNQPKNTTNGVLTDLSTNAILEN